VQAPNLTRLAERSVVFDNNCIGSMPCMPARRDLWIGCQEFLWRPWGSLEPWDQPLPRLLRDAGIMTQLVTDHYHLFERGGENYHIDFEGWELIRGHENDPWVTCPATPPGRVKGVLAPRYVRNMSRFHREEDWLSPRTFQAASAWLEENHHAHAPGFFLMIDEFDPHEPFHVPPPYDTMYDPDWDGPFFVWPEYGRPDYSEAEARHARAQYAGKVTMADRWLGQFLDRMDKFDLWENTMVVLMTDHGHFLGEHGWWGKPTCPQYQTIAHTPLFIHMPGSQYAGQRRQALTTTVDLYPTILDFFGVPARNPLHGRSLMPIVRGECDKVRDWNLYGWFGAHVQYTDGQYTYVRSAKSETNEPLFIYTNRWSTAPWWEIPIPDHRLEVSRFLPTTDMPVGRMPVAPDIMRRLHCEPERAVGTDYLFEVRDAQGGALDEAQERNLVGSGLEKEYETRLRNAMRTMGAPEEQFVRLAL
jgi:arylsulfatase A-like enzyme